MFLAETFCIKLKRFQINVMRSSRVRFPASGALGLISSAGTSLSSLRQQSHVTSSIAARFAAVISAAKSQFTLNTSPEKLYMIP